MKLSHYKMVWYMIYELLEKTQSAEHIILFMSLGHLVAYKKSVLSFISYRMHHAWLGTCLPNLFNHRSMYMMICFPSVNQVIEFQCACKTILWEIKEKNSTSLLIIGFVMGRVEYCCTCGYLLKISDHQFPFKCTLVRSS